MIKLLDILKEVDYSLHVNRYDEFDVDKLEKYGGGTDALIMMNGRGTGHFGSGTYLSTYKQEWTNFNLDSQNIRDVLDKNYGKPLIQVSSEIYAIDLDRYNLYRPKNEEHAEILFQLLKTINDLFFIYSRETKQRRSVKQHLTDILDSCRKLDLKFTKEFVKKVRYEVMPNYSDNWKGGANLKYRASISTMFMEDNGWNGVNVNGIPVYDSTLHGSVIYDMKNVVDAPKQTPNYYKDTYSMRPKNLKDIITKANKFSFGRSHIINLSNSEINRLLKMIDYYIISYYDYNSDFKSMQEEGNIDLPQVKHVKKVYPNILFNKIKDLDFENKEISDEIYGFLIMYLDKNPNDYDKKYLKYLSKNYYRNRRVFIPKNGKDVLNNYLESLDYESLDENEKFYYDELKDDIQ
jgi:hypothetical protein